MISKTSPYVLGLGLYLVSLVYRFGTGNFALGLALLVPILATVAYTFFINPELLKRSFKEKAAFFQIIIGVVIEQLFAQHFSTVFKAMDPAIPTAVVIIILIAITVAFWLLNYLLITLGNRLGLYLLKKIK